MPKTSQHERTPRRKRSKVNTHKLGLQIALLVAIMAAVGYLLFTMRQQQGLTDPMGRHVPPYYESVERAMPLPETAMPEKFSDRKAARAYEIAQRIPETLVQLPSYCGERGLHHRSLLHCFIRDSAARCEACLKQAYLADSLLRAGKTASDIRAAMIAGEWQRIDLNAIH